MKLRESISARLREFMIFILRILDFCVVFSAGLAAFWLRHGFVTPTPLQTGLLAIAPFVIGAALSLTGCYSPRHFLKIRHSLKCIFVAGTLSVLLLLVLGYITKTTEEYSRFWLGLWALALLPSLIVVRLAMRRTVARMGAAGLLHRRVALVGDPAILDKLCARLNSNPTAFPCEIIFRVTIEPDKGTDLSAPLAEIEENCRRLGPPDDFVLAFPGHQTAALEQVVSGIRHYWANIELCPDHAFIGLPFRDVRTIAGVPVLRLVTRPFEGWQGIAKWLEDKVLALCVLIAAMPLMALIAVVIKVDSKGPILFRQQRFGFGNHPITVLKFRTMHVNRCDNGNRQATRDDPRVTPVGRILRRTSLDELPQLFNVLAGSMSLVGPRPHAVPHNLEFAPLVQDYLSRHRIKPGMTGWAQVNGLRGEIANIDELRRRVEHDLYYIENWSLELDAVIMMRTLLVVLTGDKAY